MITTKEEIYVNRITKLEREVDKAVQSLDGAIERVTHLARHGGPAQHALLALLQDIQKGLRS